MKKVMKDISCRNLDTYLRWAEECNDTKLIVKHMLKSWENGGIYGVGPFYAQVILNVATKMELLMNS